MTPHQKAFAAWIQEWKESCIAHGGVVKLDYSGCWKAEFQTKLGPLSASIHESDYESQKKRGFVSIYMRFGMSVDAGTLKRIMPGQFNGCSGKWNIHMSGDKSDVANIRQAALGEFEARLNFCNQYQDLGRS